MQVTWGTTGYITSLLEWLDEVKLAIHLPGMIYNSPYAMWIKLKTTEKKGKRRMTNVGSSSRRKWITWQTWADRLS
jgi:hypothetical protein